VFSNEQHLCTYGKIKLQFMVENIDTSKMKLKKRLKGNEKADL